MERTKVSKTAKNGLLNKRVYVILLLITLLGGFLRIWHLDKVPVSMFGDELDVGYHAYSILKTGKDYSGNAWPLHFQSLAEFRTPLYLYSAVPTVALFGISPLGVRLPAAIFGILAIPVIFFLIRELTRDFKSEGKSTLAALVGALLLSLSPWHIQYSRAAFEVTLLLILFMSGILFFLYSLRIRKNLLWISAAMFALTPWVYSTAKFFTPFFVLGILIIYLKQIIVLPKKVLVFAAISFFVIGAPIGWSTLFGGGTARFEYISVFSEPIESQIGDARLLEAKIRGESGEVLSPTLSDKVFHNKFVVWSDKILSNYLTSVSATFLFISGDPNPRHTIHGIGLFYSIEILGFISGVVFWLRHKNTRTKLLLFGWFLLAIIPSAITRDGGTHATRLILMLVPAIVLIASGFTYLFDLLTKKLGGLYLLGLVVLYLVSFISYQHNYWYLNPWQSEKWWHSGWSEAVNKVKELDPKYSNVIITSADEPPWIFFAAHYQYDPETWQQSYPLKTHELAGFGKVSHIDKFSFGSPELKSFYDWGKVFTKDMLYLASAKEVNVDLIKEPSRTPSDLVLLGSVAYPSGEPAFYLFSKK